MKAVSYILQIIQYNFVLFVYRYECDFYKNLIFLAITACTLP